MEAPEFSLSRLTHAQKLELMERLWADLTQEDPSFDSPHWHEPILRDREAALAGGTMGVSDWEEAKEIIRRNVACK